MKTSKLSMQIASPRRAWLLATLVVCVPTLSLAENAQANGPKKFPKRLPAVTKTGTSDPSGSKLTIDPPAKVERRPAKSASRADVRDSLSPGQRSPFTPAVLKTQSASSRTQNSVSAHGASATLNSNDVSAPDLRELAKRNWLPTMSSSAANEISRRLIFEGSVEYGVGAWASAESTAWESLRWAAEAVDMADRESGSVAAQPTAAAMLERARDTIREARDFSGIYGQLDSPAIYRIAKSHRTELLHRNANDPISAGDAADRYLDQARMQLASIASRSDQAARTMDLLAAIYLARADVKTLPSATALCLRRAALQGQPKNANLAYRLGMHLSELGLLAEARWALEHSLSLEPNRQTAEVLATLLRRTGEIENADHVLAEVRRDNELPALHPDQPRVPEIVTLSPAEFAALSRPVMPINDDQVQVSLASGRTGAMSKKASEDSRNNESANDDSASDDSSSDTPTGETVAESDAEEPGAIRRFMRSLKRIW